MSNQALSMSNYRKNIPFSKIIIDSLVTQIVAQKVARKNCAKLHANLNTQKVLIRKLMRFGYLVYSKTPFLFTPEAIIHPQVNKYLLI